MEVKHKHKEGLTVGYKDNQLATIDSREVAQMLGKEHSYVLEMIQGREGKLGIIPVLENANLAVSKYFIPSTYRAGTREYKCYLVTKMGCELLGNKQQGEKGILFTAKYVERFNQMEQVIKGQAEQLTTEELLELQFKYAKEVKAEVMELRDDLNSFKDNAPLFNVECDDLMDKVKSIATKVLGGYGSPAYKNKSLSSRVYADIQYQIRREFQVRKYKAIKRKDLEKALDILSNYRSPLVLDDEIRQVNNQINFEEVI